MVKSSKTYIRISTDFTRTIDKKWKRQFKRMRKYKDYHKYFVLLVSTLPYLYIGTSVNFSGTMGNKTQLLFSKRSGSDGGTSYVSSSYIENRSIRYFWNRKMYG